MGDLPHVLCKLQGIGPAQEAHIRKLGGLVQGRWIAHVVEVPLENRCFVIASEELDPFPADLACVNEEGRDADQSSDVENLTGYNLLVPRVHQLVGGVEGIRAETSPDVAIEGPALQLIPDDVELPLMEPLQGAQLVPEVFEFKLTAAQLQPWTPLPPPKRDLPPPQGVAQCARYELC